MRKRIIPHFEAQPVVSHQESWLPMEALAQVDVTSEAVDQPIEAALGPGSGAESQPGWRAAGPGRQTIRLWLVVAQRVSQIRLVIEEKEQARTQELVLRWSRDGGTTFSEIVRQQFNFAPPGTTREVEDYRVVLDQADVIELEIIPEVSGGSAIASLRELRLGPG